MPDLPARASLRRSLSAITLGAALGACTGPSSNTTTTSETDTGSCPIGSEGCPCTTGGTCDTGLVCASNLCVGESDSSEGLEPTTTLPTTTGPSTATIAGVCSPANDMINDSCGEAAPYCNTKGECVDCNGIASCATADPEHPACDAASGQCVQCTADDTSACTGETPICDIQSLQCRPCEEHADCSGSACDLETGACFPVDGTLWVDGSRATCDDAAAGTEDAPLCTISAALGKVTVDAPRAVLVHEGDYAEALEIDGGITVAIVRDGAGPVRLVGVGAASVQVGAGARAFFEGVELRANGDGDGLACSGGGAVWFDRSTSTLHRGSGLRGEGCAVRVRASVFHKNTAQGLFLTGGTLRLENAFVTDNGDKMTEPDRRGGVALAGGATAHIVYSTLVGNSAYIGGSASVDCDEDEAVEAVTLRNSIAINLQGYATFQTCTDVEIALSAYSSQEAPQGDNVAVGDGAQLLTLMSPDAALPGVYRPLADTPIAGVAYLQDGDPAQDFEGDPRPIDMMSYAGADQPAP